MWRLLDTLAYIVLTLLITVTPILIFVAFLMYL